MCGCLINSDHNSASHVNAFQVLMRLDSGKEAANNAVSVLERHHHAGSRCGCFRKGWHGFSLEKEFGLVQPFKGLNVNTSLHIPTQTGAVFKTLQAIGATVL